MTVYPELDPFAYALEALPTDDPGGAALVPDRETYYRDMGTADAVLTGDLTLKVGDRTFHLLHTPGHTPGQIAVYVPEERAVFTGDTIFSGCQTWLMTSNVEQWLAALERIRTLDVDWIVPGHGPVVTKQYLDVQRSHLMEWKTAVAAAIAKGWSRDETVARVSFKDRFGPVDIGQGYMLDYIQTWNAGSLWDKLTGAIPGA
jgi:cyclase